MHYPNFCILEVGIIVSVEGFDKPSLPKLSGNCVKSKGTIIVPTIALGDKV